MGILVGLEQVGHEWPGKQVLSDQTIGIYEGDRIGIVGRNGDGKSTLLGLVAKSFEPDSGSVTWRNGIRVGLLGQSDSLDDSSDVLHAIVGDLPEYEWAGDPRTREIMDALTGDIPRDARVGELSGGQRRRVDLARLLIASWDVLCLDEPTNHLDVVAINWLAEHLKSRWPAGSGALLVVTHDRWFLDEVMERMWEVHDRVIEPFEGGFSAYIQQRAERARVAAVAEARRQSILRKELAWLSRGPKARTSKPRFRLEEARALIADVPELRNPIELKRLAVSRLGKQVIELTDVSFAYDQPSGLMPDEVSLDNATLRDISWIIGPGDRVGILGENGAGKSTLLELMHKQLAPTVGRVKVGKSVRFGILSQRLELFREMGDWRVENVLKRYKSFVVVDGKETSSSKLLERLGFSRKEFFTRIDELSGGQQRRLALLLVLLEEPNVLILDEPGNDLDTDMLAVVEDLLDTWPGTLILVTHDRYLMERVVDDEYAILDGHLRHLPGGVDEYLRLVEESRRGEAPSDGAGTPAAEGEPEPAATPAPSAPGKLSNTERRDAKRRFDSVSRRLDKALAEPERIEAELAATDVSDYETLARLTAELEAAKAAISELEEEWLELSELLGE